MNSKLKNAGALLFFILIAPKLMIGQVGNDQTNPASARINNIGFFNITEFNAGFGLGVTDVDYSRNFVGLTSIIGYGITKNFQAGIGSGFLFYNGGNLVPLFMDLRSIINYRKFAFYAFGEGGVLFDFSNKDSKNRILLNPGLGIRYSITNNFLGNIGVGIFRQVTKDKEVDSFINFKLGMTFTFGK